MSSTGNDDGTAKASLNRLIRGEIFTWIGIVGCAFTLSTKLSEVREFAERVHWVVEHFSAITAAFWNLLGSAVGVHVSAGLAKVLSFLTFYGSMTFGTLLLTGERRTLNISVRNVPNSISLDLSGIALIIVLIFTMILVLKFSYTSALITTIVLTILFNVLPIFIPKDVSITELVLISIMMLFTIRTFISGVYNSFSPDYLAKYFDYFRPLTLITASLLTITPMFFVPSQILTRRLTFILIGVAIIFGLSEFSKFVASFQTAAPS